MLPIDVLKIFGDGAAGLSSPADLFAGGIDGAWWEVTPGHVWKDTAGTIPATADGDLVARIDDRSGNGHHLLQATAVNRPVLKIGTVAPNVGKMFVRCAANGGNWQVMSCTHSVFGNNWTRVSAMQPAGIFDGRLWSDAGSGSSDIALRDSTSAVTLRVPTGNGPGASNSVPNSFTMLGVITERWRNPAPCAIAWDNNAFTNTPSIAGLGPRGVWLGMSWVGTNEGGLDFSGAVYINRILSDPEEAYCRTYVAALQGRVL